MSLLADIAFALRPRCPHCRNGRLFKPWSLATVDACAACGTPLAKNDVGDGASVFAVFVLGFLLVPSAWFFDQAFAPPVWVHMVLWSAAALGLTAVLLPAVKAYIILLEYRHRPK